MKKALLVSVFLLTFLPTIALGAICAQTTSAQDDYYGLSGTLQWHAAKFTLSAPCAITQVQALLNKVGSPSDNVYFSLYSDSSGSPGSLLQTGSNVAASSLTSTFTLTATPLVYSASAGTYWLILHRSGTLDGSNQAQWGANAEATSNHYYSSNAGVSWGASAEQMLFEIDASGGGGGSTSTVDTNATSTLDQTQQNFDWVIGFFFVSFFGVVWLLRASRR